MRRSPGTARPGVRAGEADDDRAPVMIPSFADAQRLAFGTVADAYERHRPGFPPGVLDLILAAAHLSAGDRVLEIGAGTGKLTAELVGRGLRVLAVEPSREMRAVLEARELPGVEMVAGDFESFTPPARFGLVVSACAWHWVDPTRRCRLARAALRSRGTLAGVWIFPDWGRAPLRAVLAEVYRVHAPGMAPDFPMHPDSAPTALAGDWVAEMDGSGLFEGAIVHQLSAARRLTAADYVGLLGTHQDHILLAPRAREPLFAALAEAIEQAGGQLALPTTTWVCLATAGR